jgi:hypothetical protein
MKPFFCLARKVAVIDTRNCSSTVNSWKKILVVFLGIFGILSSIMTIFCIYSTIFFHKPYRYNNNNNNIYLLQMGCHPVAVITLHVFPNTASKFT